MVKYIDRLKQHRDTCSVSTFFGIHNFKVGAFFEMSSLNK